MAFHQMPLYGLTIVLIVAIVSGQRSPCPDTFIIDSANATYDTWFGRINLYRSVQLHGIFVDLIFDRVVENVGTHFYEVTTQDGVEFNIEDRNRKLRPGEVLDLNFFVKYQPSQGVPRLIEIRLNGQNICSDTGGGRTPTPIVNTRQSVSDDNQVPSTSTIRIPAGIFTQKPTTESYRTTIRSTTRRTTTKSPYFPGDLTYLTSKPKVPEEKIPPLDNCGTIIPKTNPLIVAGEETYRGQFPWHAALYVSTAAELRYICGGSLISKHAIITAAHCVTHQNSRRSVNPEDLLIYLGKYNLRKWTGPEVDVKVSELIINPKYDNERFYSDVAIVKFRSEIEFTDYIRPVCLWNFGDDLRSIVGSVGEVPGWGFNEHGLISEDMSFIKMQVVAHETCIWSDRDFFSRVTSDVSFCAGFRNGSSVCNGDSGGGMVFKQGSKWYLRGVVSVSIALQNHSICDPNHYAVFSDLAKFISWIKDNL